MRSGHVPLFYGDIHVADARVDRVDRSLVEQYGPWRIDWQRGSQQRPRKHPHPYARRDFRIEGKKFTLYLHRLLVVGFERLQDGMVVDHINGDTFDNRRSNLRLVPVSDNNRNRRDECACDRPDLYYQVVAGWR